MGKTTVRRLNCINGWWHYPDPETGPERLNVAEMAARYASQAEGRTISPEDFANLQYNFRYDNPRQRGEHGVPGTVQLSWKLRERR